MCIMATASFLRSVNSHTVTSGLERTRRASTDAWRTAREGLRMPVQMHTMNVRTCMLNTAGMATASSFSNKAAARAQSPLLEH